jgi:hypothetical protein
MNPKYPLIAAAVAAALSVSSIVHAAAPSLAQAESPNYSLIISGSSAAKNSIAAAIENDLCGGLANTSTFTSTGASTNFFAYSCIPTTNSTNSQLGSIVNGSNIFTIYYRDEGGSVTGALPIASSPQVPILRLSLAGCAGGAYPTYTCAITCAAAGTNPPAPVCGPNDSWAGATVSDHVQMGVTDVEPKQLTNADYPSGYNSANFGSASASQMAGLTKKVFVDQVFGLFINTSGGAITSVNLSKESYAAILLGANPSTVGYTDWTKVPDALTGKPMASAPQTITRIDREPGSGTRTSANIYFLGYQCGSSNSIQDYSSEVDNYSTGDELNAAEATAGAIAYASIDNWYSNLSNGTGAQTKYTNLALATINGVTPSNLAAASGAYDYWFEATTVANPSAYITTGSAAGSTSAEVSWIQNDMPQLGSVPQVSDILAIPGAGATPNKATVPLTSLASGTKEVYINPFTRNGSSCSVPTETTAL